MASVVRSVIQRARPMRAVRVFGTSTPRRSDALFVVRIVGGIGVDVGLIIGTCSTATRRITTPKYVSLALIYCLCVD